MCSPFESTVGFSSLSLAAFSDADRSPKRGGSGGGGIDASASSADISLPAFPFFTEGIDLTFNGEGAIFACNDLTTGYSTFSTGAAAADFAVTGYFLTGSTTGFTNGLIYLASDFGAD